MHNYSTAVCVCTDIYILYYNTGEATTNPPKENTSSLTFSLQEEVQYSVRFEEGYDVYDERYESWLKINHPGAVSKTCTTSSPQISEAQKTPLSSTSPSVSSESSVSGQSSRTESPSQSSPLLASIPTPMSSNGVSKTSLNTTPSSSCQTQSAPGTTPLITAAKRRSPLSDLLNLQSNIRKAGSKTTSTGRARVLTSDECLRLLKEKEEKKKQVEVEKEKRKMDRELKKKQREEEKKQKAEEKA